jgi:hypothetical protein
MQGARPATSRITFDSADPEVTSGRPAFAATFGPYGLGEILSEPLLEALVAGGIEAERVAAGHRKGEQARR